jgi:hypothetical protein
MRFPIQESRGGARVVREFLDHPEAALECGILMVAGSASCWKTRSHDPFQVNAGTSGRL